MPNDLYLPPAQPTRLPRPAVVPVWMPPVASVALVALASAVRLGIFHDRVMPIGFGVPLLAFVWLRSKRWLWITAGGFAVITLLKFGYILPHMAVPVLRPNESLPDIILLLFDLLVITGLVHLIINISGREERRITELDAANHELAAREEELARGNEELQSQAEELERQSEELRVTNEDLASRERTLEILLSLSRSLAASADRGKVMDRLCEATAVLLDGQSTSSAILEREGEEIVVRCERGFAGGVREPRIPAEKSFAAIVLDQGQTGYVDDLARRPDLVVPHAAGGAPTRSIMATPLKVDGKSIGVIEVYSPEPRAWSDAQVTLLESLAAQASVSLAAADLYARVERERARLRTVVETAPVPIMIADDPTGAMIRGNPAAAILYGAPVDANFSPVGGGARGVRRAFYRDGKPVSPEQLPLMRSILTGATVYNEEVQIVLPDRSLTALVSAAPFYDANGAVRGAVAAMMDITQLKALQRELDTRRREAEEAAVRKTRFLAAVSHDIRTPANAISLLAELVRRTADNPAMASEVPELARELHASAMSLITLLGDVLDLARFDSGRIDLLESEFPLSALFADELRSMTPLARQKQIELRYHTPESPIHLRTDRIKLSRVLGNLVGNAIKFTDAGQVDVASRRTDDGGVELRVSDSGVGIPKEHLASIFDEFVQLRNPERDRNKGTGLGLTICKRLVDAIGGRIEVTSEPGRGSAFTVVLPPTAVVPALRQD